MYELGTNMKKPTTHCLLFDLFKRIMCFTLLLLLTVEWANVNNKKQYESDNAAHWR